MFSLNGACGTRLALSRFQVCPSKSTQSPINCWELPPLPAVKGAGSLSRSQAALAACLCHSKSLLILQLGEICLDFDSLSGSRWNATSHIVYVGADALNWLTLPHRRPGVEVRGIPVSEKHRGIKCDVIYLFHHSLNTLHEQSLNRVPASAGVKAGKSHLLGRIK